MRLEVEELQNEITSLQEQVSAVVCPVILVQGVVVEEKNLKNNLSFARHFQHGVNSFRLM